MSMWGAITKRPLHCDHFIVYCASPFYFSSFLILSPELSVETLIAKREKLGEEMCSEFFLRSISFVLVRLL
jgi:hypothetical protein